MSRAFSGLHMHLGNLATLSSARTRSISAENPSGEQGQGGRATSGTGAAAARELGAGWKISPSIHIAPGDVVTLAVDEHQADRLEESTRYRLLTLSADPRIDREFASLLRSADETMAVLEVEPGSELEGEPVESLSASVVAIRPPSGPIEPIPEHRRALAVGDTLYVIARPETVRRLERRVAGTESDDGPGTVAENS